MKSFLKVLFFLILFPQMLQAGGPMIVYSDNSGLAQRWADDSVVIYADPGKLCTNVDNKKATDWIKEAAATWNDVLIKPAVDKPELKTSLLIVVYSGTVTDVSDIDDTNFQNYFQSNAGPSVIVFDADGSIISLLGYDVDSIGGLTTPTFSDNSDKKILRGISILNGKMLCDSLSKASTASEQTQIENNFKALITHEMGHLLNLDHTQVNLSEAENCNLNGVCDGAQYISTMYPELKTFLQANLNMDDQVALSSIYPTDDFKKSFCVITGQLLDADSIGLSGVNVIARQVGEGTSTAKSDARSNVSGSFWKECAGKGKYYLYGIKPGKKYQVTYEPIASQFVGSYESSFEPITNPPQGFTGGLISDKDGNSTVSCGTGGETIEMDVIKVNTTNPCASVLGKEKVDDTKSAATPPDGGGSCSMMPLRKFKVSLILILCAIPLVIYRFKFLKKKGRDEKQD
ncbi:MAG: hypothetical protein ABIE74_01760 [Pseudomonadota bacterium]